MKARRLIRSAGRALACGAGLIAGGYAAYVAMTWRRYGQVRPGTDHDEDPLLDGFMPTYEIVERHHVHVAAPAAVTFAAACKIDLRQSSIIGAIFKTREALLGSRPDSSDRPRGLVPWALSLGWGVLADISGREIVVGAVTRPWDANVVFRPLSPDKFLAFNEPDYVKIAWTLRADPINDRESVARTETRAVATDRTARRKFRRYWSIFSPGIVLIRRVAFRLVKAEAERRMSSKTDARRRHETMFD